MPVLRSLWADSNRRRAPRGLRPSAYGGDPTAWQHEHRLLESRRRDDGTALVLELPFTERDDVSLVRRGDELHVTVGPYRRALLLPDSLRRRKVVDASVRDDCLTVLFAPAQ